MSTIKTVRATPDNPLPLPPHGGDWVRQPNGDLTLVQTTAPEEAASPTTEPAPAPAPTPAASGKQPPKE